MSGTEGTMTIIPKEKPIIENLNSYYLDVKRMFEHYQGELGSGGVHFKSSTSEGIIFFDKDDFLNGVFRDKEGPVEGNVAIKRLLTGALNTNYTIDIYKIDPDEVYFWANLPAAEEVYRNLTTDFTDLEGLIKKMCAERLTGFIDVAIGKGQEGGLIFFNNGEIVGGSYSWGNGRLNGSAENQERLIEKTRAMGGIFQVCKIPLEKNRGAEPSSEVAPGCSPEMLDALAYLLSMIENLFQTTKKTKKDFGTLLKSKFLQKADRYPFLDPFAAEFEYADQKVAFHGQAGNGDVLQGLLEALEELADEFGLFPQYAKELESWRQEYAPELAARGIRL
jgi:hypothetical protein